MELTNLLTILDKPKHPQSALDRALTLQDQTGADLELASFCWNPLVDSKSTLNADQRRGLRRKLMQERRKWLTDLVQARQLRSEETLTQTVWSNNIARWVSDYAVNAGTDLVVKSAHPSQTLLHTPLDWKLLDNLRVPILFTSSARRPARKSTKRAIVAAIDLRHNDKRHQKLNHRVLEAAHCFAQAQGGVVHCVSAIELSIVLRDLDLIDARSVKRKLLRESKDTLQALLKPYRIPATRQHFPVGKAGLTVNQVARKLKADLLVVGTNARRTTRLLGLGNSAQRILSRAITDVLAVSP